MPDFVRPETNGSVIMSPPVQPKPSWAATSPGPSTSTVVQGSRRHLPVTPSDRSASMCIDFLLQFVLFCTDINVSLCRSSSEGEFAQSGVIRRPHKPSSMTRREANLARFALHAARISDSVFLFPSLNSIIIFYLFIFSPLPEEESSPESHASTRSTSPRRSLATPSSYDSSHNQTAPPTHHEDARSIDSGVVQSDHSNPQQILTLSVSSLTPFSVPSAEASSPRRISQSEISTSRVAQSASGTSLVTPPPIPPRTSPVPSEHRPSPVPSIDLQPRKISMSSTASTKRAGTSNDSMNIIETMKPLKIYIKQSVRSDSPSASFMSSPEDDSISRIDSSRLHSEGSNQSITPLEESQLLADETETTPTIRSSASPDDIVVAEEPGAAFRRRTTLFLLSCFYPSEYQVTVSIEEFFAEVEKLPVVM
uniref:Flocculation protein FLO11-like n=1 Tax=Heterorhabditis bacteriophora TaxID=37862 RepID=A0A1I7X6M7_HETBA